MRAGWLLCLTLWAANALAADDFAALAGQLNAAHKAGDYAAMEAAADKLLALRPGYPRLEYLLAVARAHRGDEAGALAALGQVADMGVYVDIAKSPDFAPLRNRPGFQALTARFASVSAPLARAKPAFHLTEPDFIPEGLAYDPGSGDFFVASVHLRKIVRVQAGKVSDFATRDAGLWSVLGLCADPARGRLWAVSSALPQMQGYDAKLEGKSALFRFDLKSGALQATYPVPQDGAGHELNDLTVAPDGSVYAADGNGGVYLLAPDSKTLRLLTPAGALESSQGLALSADSRRLYIADYERGLYAYEFSSGRLLRLSAPAAVNTYYVDGLVRHGRDLVAIENAAEPQRVIRFHLDASGLAVTGAEVLDSADPLAPEPTLETVVGDTLYFVANSQWSRFDEAGQLPPMDQLQPPSIVELPLD
ncbi:MAG TPA: SMP-30/gluconolactonase/LRE family protein [Gammaproteobacteria bacterium]|nr:SMP-30/gluconolactonase/LRE family protein [Gammaproteobacteria bacterium]